MKFIIALIIGVLYAGNVTAQNQYVSSNNYGGLVHQYIAAAELLEEFQTLVVFDQACVSACTLYLGTQYTFPKCMKKGTIFGFHKPRFTKDAKIKDEDYLASMTKAMWDSYPQPIKDFLTLHGWPEGNKYTIMLDKDMEGVLPYC